MILYPPWNYSPLSLTMKVYVSGNSHRTRLRETPTATFRTCHDVGSEPRRRALGLSARPARWPREKRRSASFAMHVLPHCGHRLMPLVPLRHLDPRAAQTRAIPKPCTTHSATGSAREGCRGWRVPHQTPCRVSHLDLGERLRCPFSAGPGLQARHASARLLQPRVAMRLLAPDERLELPSAPAPIRHVR